MGTMFRGRAGRRIFRLRRSGVDPVGVGCFGAILWLLFETWQGIFGGVEKG
jgi:hypothetical protein